MFNDQEADSVRIYLALAFGVLGFGLLVLLQLLSVAGKAYPDEFSVREHGCLAAAVALLIVYGALANAWVVWFPFALQFIASFLMILVKFLRFRREGYAAY